MSTNKSTKSKASRTKGSAKTAKNNTVKRGTSSKNACPPNKLVSIIFLVILGVAALVALSFITITVTVRMDDTYISSRTDAGKFASEYTQVSSDNVFVYKNGQETIDILEHGTGIVFLGFPSCPWCQRYAKYLNEVAKEKGIEKIYYHNTYDDWQNNTEEYQKITKILSNFLQYNDEGQRHLYVPDVAFVVNGQVVGNDLESSKNTAGYNNPDEYWTETRVSELKARLANFMELIKLSSGCEASCDNS